MTVDQCCVGSSEININILLNLLNIRVKVLKKIYYFNHLKTKLQGKRRYLNDNMVK